MLCYVIPPNVLWLLPFFCCIVQEALVALLLPSSTSWKRWRNWRRCESVGAVWTCWPGTTPRYARFGVLCMSICGMSWTRSVYGDCSTSYRTVVLSDTCTQHAAVESSAATAFLLLSMAVRLLVYQPRSPGTFWLPFLCVHGFSLVYELKARTGTAAMCRSPCFILLYVRSCFVNP